MTAFLRLLPDMRDILEHDAVESLEVDLRQIELDHSEHRHDGDPLHDWQNQNALIELTQKIFRIHRDEAKTLVFVGTCFPRRRARCNAARALAEQLRNPRPDISLVKTKSSAVGRKEVSA